MPKRRLLAPPEFPAAIYHCYSRVVDGNFVLRFAEKERFVRLLREAAAFCGVRVLTFCVLDNHFHILVEVPGRPAQLPGAESVLAKLEALTSRQDIQRLRGEIAALRSRGDAVGERDLLQRYWRRMWNLGEFMKMIKQRYSRWHNARHGRRGTLWEGRYHSVLVDGAGEACVTMAAYIDLNPVRAGIVRDPKDYRWCGYGEAVAGQGGAREGVGILAAAVRRGTVEGWKCSMATYRLHLYLEGNERREKLGEDGHPTRGTTRREDALKVLAENGRLPMAQYLKCRVRYFHDGAVLGTLDFVEKVFRGRRDHFGPQRRDGARRMRGVEVELYAARDLRKSLFA